MVGHPIPVPFGKRCGRYPPDALPVPFQKSEPDKTEDKPPAPPEPKQKKSRHWLLLPLVKSHTNGAVEDELKHLTITLFQKHLNDRAIDIDCYGMPHLGGKMLLQKYLVSQGISNFNVSALDEDTARWLLMAWRYCNGKRGTHFLRTFITCLWGSDFEIEQLWQKKDGVYPNNLKSEQEILEDGESLDDYFLTPRLNIALDGASGYFASEIARSLNTVLPARLFVVSVGRTNKVPLNLPIQVVSSGFSLVKGVAEDISSTEELHQTAFRQALGASSGAYSIAYGHATAT